jgi:hypothetical protein
MWKKWLKNNWKRWFVITACIIFIVDRQVWHRVQFDPMTTWLVAVIAFFLIFPSPQVIFPYVKRFKIWEVEIELKEDIKMLEKEVEKAQDVGVNNTSFEATGNVSAEVEDVLRESSRNPRAALLLPSTKLESQIKKRLADAGVKSSRPLAALPASDLGVKSGIFPPEFISALRDFWSVRNRIAHGEAFDVNDNTILSLISLGTELLKVISTEKTS